MFLIARRMGEDKGGEKAEVFRLSQPRGAVTTTSSNSRVEPPSMVTRTFLDLDSTEITLVFSRTSAFSSAVLATRSRIAL